MGRYKNRELAHIGVDYIRALITQKNENNLINKLSKNSNFMSIDFYGCELTIEMLPIGSAKWRKFYQIRYKNISIAFVGLEGITKGKITPMEMIEITGQGLNIFGVEVYFFLMDKFEFNFIKYKRIDFAMDIFLNTHYFWEKILMQKFKDEKTYLPFMKEGKMETIYFGERDIKKNNYQLVRIYNKIVDSVKKEKLFLYHDERKNGDNTIKDVTRFEVEIREDLAKFYDYYDINDINIIFAKMVKTFFKFNKQFFKFFDFSEFNGYFEKQEKDKNEKKKLLKQIKAGNTDIIPKTKYQEKILKKMKGQETYAMYGHYFLSDKEKQDTLTMFISYAKKLYVNGYKIDDLNSILVNNCLKIDE